MLKLRVITATIIAIVFLTTLLALSPLYLGLLALLVLGAASWEWARLSRLKNGTATIFYVLLQLGLFAPFFVATVVNVSPEAFALGTPLTFLLILAGLFWVLAALAVLRYPDAPASWMNDMSIPLVGIVALLAAVVSLLVLRVTAHGEAWILYCVAVVAAADIGAYFSGRRWGRRKLAPNVSPGKSWEGFWGGLVAAQLVAVLFFYGFGAEIIVAQPAGKLYLLMFITLLLSSVSVFGDLFESLLKRRVGFKDSSQLLPGHGGVLDRIDGLIAALPILVICQRALGWS